MLIWLKKYYVLPGHGQIDFGGKVLTRTRHAALCISDGVTTLSMHCFLQWKGRRRLWPMKTKNRERKIQGGKRQRTRARVHLWRKQQPVIRALKAAVILFPFKIKKLILFCFNPFVLALFYLFFQLLSKLKKYDMYTKYNNQYGSVLRFSKNNNNK